ncbi:hypothetical protein PR003_g30123, partial [Phytophthora rubi]
MQQDSVDGHGPGPPDPGIRGDVIQDGRAEAPGQQPSPVVGVHPKSRQETSPVDTNGRRIAGGANGEQTTTTVTDEGDEEESRVETPETRSTRETWGDKVRAHAPNTECITEGMARKSHMLEGVWNPVHIKQLVGTLMTDWTYTETKEWTAEEITMRQEAQAPARACCDDSVRAGTARENDILTAYLAGQLDLPLPPNFLKETMIGEHRAMIEDMHEAYLNATLTAVIPATVRLSRTTAHAVIFRELFHANTDRNSGQTMMRAFQRDVKRLSYDGIQTLQVVFYSRTAANRWVGKAMRLQKAVIVLRDTQRAEGQEHTGLYTEAQVFATFTDAKVLDVEYARETRTNIYDNRVNSLEALRELLRKHQPQRQPPGLLTTVTIDHGVSAHAEGDIEEGAAEQPREVREVKSAALSQDADGFTTKETKRTKAAKLKKGKAHTTETVEGTQPHAGKEVETKWSKKNKEQSGSALNQAQEHNARSRTGVKNGAGQTARAAKPGKAPRKPTKRFEQFQRHEALGQYSVLADSDSEESDADAMDIDEQATVAHHYYNAEGDDAPY